MTLVHAGSDADDRHGALYTLRRAGPAAERRLLVARRQVVNLPRFEASLARLDVRTGDPRRDLPAQRYGHPFSSRQYVRGCQNHVWPNPNI